MFGAYNSNCHVFFFFLQDYLEVVNEIPEDEKDLPYDEVVFNRIPEECMLPSDENTLL